MQLVLLLTRIRPIDNHRTSSIIPARKSQFGPTSIPQSDHLFLVLLSWGNCKTILCPWISRLLMVGKCWHRYSNTLLASLNNRISIREVSSARGALPTSRTLAAPTSKDPSSIVHVELEKSPHAFKGRKESGEDKGQESVIGGYCGASFPSCPSTLGPD
jgi:hypothetical protein